MPDWRDVQGWLSESEGAELQRLAAGLTVLEVGCWKGRSTVCLAQAAARVVSVDHFAGDEYAGRAFTLPEAVETVAALDVRGCVTLVAGAFADVVPLLRLERFGLFFYDADHTYQATADALAAILGGASPSAPVAVHDYDPAQPVWADCIRAVDEAARRHGRAVRVVDRLAILETQPC